MVDYLITEEWYNQRMNDAEDEAERIVKTAAKLIMEDIRSVRFENEFYPTKESMADVKQNLEWLPPYLKLLMLYLVKIPLKQASFRPRNSSGSKTKIMPSPHFARYWC